MRICMLADAYTIRVQRLAAGLVRRGHDVRIVSHRVCAVPSVVVERYSVPRFGWRYPSQYAHRKSMYLRRLMRRHDVVHVQFLQDFGLTPRIAAAGRLVVSPLGSDIVNPPDAPPCPEGTVRMRREMLHMADAVSVCSRAFAAEVAGFGGLSVEDIAVVPMGVDLEQFQRRSEGPVRPLTVGFLKGFKAVYGPTVLIQAIPKVLSRVPQARFQLAGDGPMLDECRTLAARIGVAHAITWMGWLPYDGVPRVLEGWDISVIPSVSESFGVAALESQAMEVPVVASRVGGLVETVRHGETGLLVRPGDSDSLAEAVVALLTDERRRRAMGTAGRRMVAREYEWGSCLEQWENLFRHVARRGVTVRETAVSGPRVEGSA